VLQRELDKVREKLIESASLVESMIDKSIRGLANSEKRMLLEVINMDEPKENELEVEIEEACIHLTARHQPQAKDLRTIMMVSKINNDLERMADEAVNVSESSLFLIDRPPVKSLIDIPTMAKETRKMVADSLSSFINEDIELARSVCQRDDIVDGLRDQILRELIAIMASDHRTVERSIQLIRISRSLERIADLSTNICEDVLYMVEAKTIRHGKFEE